MKTKSEKAEFRMQAIKADRKQRTDKIMEFMKKEFMKMKIEPSVFALRPIWNDRKKYVREGHKLINRGNLLQSKGNHIVQGAYNNFMGLEGDTLTTYSIIFESEFSRGRILRLEGAIAFENGMLLIAKGNKMWADAIMKRYGNIKITWENDIHCILENGKVFK